MRAYFLDTSALVKRYVVENGTPFITQITDPNAGNELFITPIAWVEMVAAFHRRARTGSISSSAASAAEQQFRCEMSFFLAWDVKPMILSAAMSLVKLHPLRAYDSIHLATALDIHFHRSNANLPALTFLSADQALNQAALAEGLLVDDPNRYP